MLKYPLVYLLQNWKRWSKSPHFIMMLVARWSTYQMYRAIINIHWNAMPSDLTVQRQTSESH